MITSRTLLRAMRIWDGKIKRDFYLSMHSAPEKKKTEIFRAVAVRPRLLVRVKWEERRKTRRLHEHRRVNQERDRFPRPTSQVPIVFCFILLPAFCLFFPSLICTNKLKVTFARERERQRERERIGPMNFACYRFLNSQDKCILYLRI